MNLQLVKTPPKFWYICVHCGQHRLAEKGRESSCWADLDGPAFVAYYCGPCYTSLPGKKGDTA